MQLLSELKFVSEQQFAVFKHLVNLKKTRINYFAGGADSGKSYIIGRAIAWDALKYPKTRHLILHKNLTTAIQVYLPPILELLQIYNLKESYKSKNTTTYFVDDRREIYLGNGSSIRLDALDRPVPVEGNRVHGRGGNSITIDEASNVSWEWFHYFFFSKRLKKSPNQKVKYFNRINLTDNTSHSSWVTPFFFEHRHPETDEPLPPLVVKNISVLKIDTWNNRLIPSEDLELMKLGGDAARFFYSDPSLVFDKNQVFQYEIVEDEFRYNYVYGMDFGQKAYTTLLQVGFGGDLSVTCRELHYKQGMQFDVNKPSDDPNDTIFGIVARLIKYHNKLLSAVLGCTPFGLRPLVNKFHLKPHIVIDSARPDIREALQDRFGSNIVVILSDKHEQKTVSTEKIKRLKIKVLKKSRHFIKELNGYRYKSVSFANQEKLPDGNDDLIDTYRYVSTYILDVFQVYSDLKFFNQNVKYHNSILQEAKIKITDFEY